MNSGARAGNYLRGNGRRHVTARQWRRLMHKYNRVNGFYYGHWGENCKGRPTPRQVKRRPARLRERVA